MPRQRWQMATPDPLRAAHLATAINLSPLITQVMINRGIVELEQAEIFLNPEAQMLPLPTHEFPDLSIALDLLVEAIAQRHHIAICGDYDADGMTSTALLIRALRFLGATVDYAIPSRMRDGYGINERIVEEFYQQQVRLILTVDNGIAAHAPIARARELGISVIITDHHDLPPELPNANAILNPKLIREDSPYRGMAGVGVAYVLAVSLAQRLRKTQDLTAPLIELFTLGTIADLAPLTGVNRRWVRRGLKLLPNSKLPGIQALIQVAGLSHEKEMKPEAIGFRLGPRINAVGRISEPQFVIDLLTTDDEGRALEVAMKCEQINLLRQQYCQVIEEQAIALCQEQVPNLLAEKVLLLVHPDWHHGVIGIVASRLVERYGVPVFIGTFEEHDPTRVRGSARGIPEFDVFAALQASSDVLDKFGGHRAAGGFSLAANQLDEFRLRLQQFANTQLQPRHLKPLVTVDAEAQFDELTIELYEQINCLHPCGIENSDPVFWTPNVRVLEQQTVGRDRSHLKLVLEQEGNTSSIIKAIAWRWGDYCPLPNCLDIAYRLRMNEWNGDSTIELELVGVRLPGDTDDADDNEAEPTLPVTAPQRLRLDNSQRLIIRSTTTDDSTSIEDSDEPDEQEADEEAVPDVNIQTQGAPASAPSRATHRRASVPTLPNLATPPTSQPPLARETAPLSQFNDTLKTDFLFSKRKYTCSWVATGSIGELQIKNPSGQILRLQPDQQQGLLAKPNDAPQAVDIGQPHYFNLVRAAVNALAIAQHHQVSQHHDHLKQAQDAQLELMRQQLDLVQSAIGQLSWEQQQQFHTLQAKLQEHETAIQTTETAMAHLHQRLHQLVPRFEPSAVKQQIQEQLGDRVWNRLDSRSQKDLQAAFKLKELVRGDRFTAGVGDYSEAAMRIGLVIEREIGQPFFQTVEQFTASQTFSTSDTLVSLKTAKRIDLNLIPPAIAPHWEQFQPSGLSQLAQPADAQLYQSVSAEKLNDRDRSAVQQALQQWSHPLAQWLQTPENEPASTLAQLAQLLELAAHPDHPLLTWQFEILAVIVVGDRATSGILQELFA